MAQQKQKGGGARKIGQKKKQPAQARYKDRAAKKRRLVRMLTRFPKYRAPGWKLSSYGLNEDEASKTR